MFTTVFLDVDNTLLDFHKCSLASLRQGFADFGLTWTEDFPETFHTVNDGLWRQLEAGEIKSRKELFDIRFDRIFEAAGIRCDGKAFEERFQQLLGESHEPVEGAMELLRYLAGKYTLCAASNSAYEHQLRRLKAAGMLPYLTHVFVSEEAGITKPDPGFFRWCFEKLGNPDKDSVVMIGDSLTADVAGCANFGIACCWFNFEGAAVPEDLKAWQVVNKLEEVQNIL